MHSVWTFLRYGIREGHSLRSCLLLTFRLLLPIPFVELDSKRKNMVRSPLLFVGISINGMQVGQQVLRDITAVTLTEKQPSCMI